MVELAQSGADVVDATDEHVGPQCLRLADLRAEQPQLGAERCEILQRPVVEIERRPHQPSLVGLPEPLAVARARM